VCGLSKDIVSAREGLYSSQLRGRMMVNWGYLTVITIAIDVFFSSLFIFFFFQKKRKKSFGGEGQMDYPFTIKDKFT